MSKKRRIVLFKNCVYVDYSKYKSSHATKPFVSLVELDGEEVLFEYLYGHVMFLDSNRVVFNKTVNGSSFSKVCIDEEPLLAKELYLDKFGRSMSWWAKFNNVVKKNS